jgi:co-chaperonin GroES (HSP10)
MNVRPAVNRVLIEVEKAKEETTASGLVIPAVGQGDPGDYGGPVMFGRVSAVGRMRVGDGPLVEPDVWLGARVVFKSGGAEDLEDGRVIVAHDAVLAVVG